MNYYESVVFDYLRADRTVFLNTEYCVQINPGDNPDTSGPHWYCDAVALNFQAGEVFLCEISYEATLSGLTKRLRGWHDNWNGVLHALVRDSFIPESWPVRPWLFVPENLVPLLEQRLEQIANGHPQFLPKITPLEKVVPWLYQSWNRKLICDETNSVGESHPHLEVL